MGIRSSGSSVVLIPPVSAASQTSIDFSGIPEWATEITVGVVGASLNAADLWRLQIGDAGGIEAFGYVGAAEQIDSTGVGFVGFGFDSISTAAANTRTGLFALKLIDRASNTWVCHALMVRTETPGDMYMTLGHKVLTGPLTQVRLTSGTGASLMDAGVFSAVYR